MTISVTTLRTLVPLMALLVMNGRAIAQHQDGSDGREGRPWVAGGLVAPRGTEAPSELQTRLMAAQGVTRPTPDLLDAIADGLSSEELLTRRAAGGAMGAVVRAISHIGSNPADVELVHRHEGLQRALLQATRDSDPITRATATSRLGSFAVPYGPHLKGVWMQLVESDPDPRVRELAVYQLGRFGADDVRVDAVVTAALTDPEPDVRKQAALSVAKLRPTGAIPILVAGLEADRDEARFEFAYALIAYGDQARQHLPLLRAVAARTSTRDERQALEHGLQALDR